MNSGSSYSSGESMRRLSRGSPMFVFMRWGEMNGYVVACHATKWCNKMICQHVADEFGVDSYKKHGE